MAIKLIDQTINFAMSEKKTSDNSKKIIAILRKFNITQFDVDFDSFFLYKDDFENLHEVCRVVISASLSQFEKVLNAGCKNIKIIVKPKLLNEKFIKIFLDYAVIYNVKITIEIFNASRLEISHIINFVNCLKSYKSFDGICYSDMESLLYPIGIFYNIKSIIDFTGAKIEVKCGNSNGLATANALTVAKLKDVKITVAMFGVGQNVPTEEFLMANNCFNDNEFFIAANLSKLCYKVARYINYDIPSNKAIIGRNIFAHESGIHVAGIIKKPSMYEVFAPEKVGLKRKVIIGKHSGRKSLKFKLNNLNLSFEETDLDKLLYEVKKYAKKIKKALTDRQLFFLYKNMYQGE